MASNGDDVLTTEILQHRLNAGLGIAGGARGSFARYASQILHKTNENPTTTDPKMDLELLQLEMTKLYLIIQRNKVELEILEKESFPETSNEDLRNELAHLQEVRSCLQEYEALAKLTVARHVVSEHQLNLDLKEIEQKTENVTNELQKATLAAKIRASQFHLVQTSIQDLKASLSQPLELDPDQLNDNNNKQQQDNTKPTDDTAKVDNMQVDDDEGELYGDLDTK